MSWDAGMTYEGQALYFVLSDLTHLSQISGSASISELPDRPAQGGRVTIREASIRPGWMTFHLNDPQEQIHTPGIAFRHLLPNSARFSYATERALFISAQLSVDAVSALWKVRVLIGL